ncbi:hypothetical protein H5410_035792 [Solanum commersonii]|uniref:Uncharacterized protein n=1 Tax=Solanum commersonii TaxID=4109 RepID=A0A9J5Y4P8_SOLCO|nr:hypothetical protein H5410_035792 [Solanum commersonii]
MLLQTSICAGVGIVGQSVGATSCSRCSGFLSEKCKKHYENSIMYLQTLSQAVNEFKNKRKVKVIPSNNVRNPYTPHAKRIKKYFIKAIQNLKKKIFGELPMVIGEKLLELKPVNIYKMVFVAKEAKMLERMKVKELHTQYDMYYFSGNDSRGHDKHENLVGRLLLNEFVWNADMIDYVRGIRPYPGDMDLIGAKRILAVMNMNNTHFVTLEILLHEGCMNVYDCNLMSLEHDKFLTFIQHMFELLPSLLKQTYICFLAGQIDNDSPRLTPKALAFENTEATCHLPPLRGTKCNFVHKD